MILTAAHVVGSLSTGYPGATEVLLGTGPASPSSGDRRIGETVESHPPEPCDEVDLDACLIRVDPHVALGSAVQDVKLSRVPRDLSCEEEPVIVYKRGVNHPALTEGLLDPTPESLRVSLERHSGEPSVRNYMKGWFVQATDGEHPFARPGDSGSIVVDEDGCAVGLLVALRSATPFNPSPDDPAFVIPILDVLDGLGIELAGPRRMCTVA